jgi:hypothetical protein
MALFGVDLMFNSLKCAVVIERNEMEPKSHSEVEITLRSSNSAINQLSNSSNSAIQQLINSSNSSIQAIHQLSKSANHQIFNQ